MIIQWNGPQQEILNFSSWEFHVKVLAGGHPGSADYRNNIHKWHLAFISLWSCGAGRLLSGKKKSPKSEDTPPSSTYKQAGHTLVKDKNLSLVCLHPKLPWMFYR